VAFVKKAKIKKIYGVRQDLLTLSYNILLQAKVY